MKRFLLMTAALVCLLLWLMVNILAAMGKQGKYAAKKKRRK